MFDTERTGIIFDISEFSVHDGPGNRVTFFLKGCPLHCLWCHNPEGQRFEPEVLVQKSRCRNCGRCSLPCHHPDCRDFNRCLHICPEGLIRPCGKRYSVSEVLQIIQSYEGLLTNGGITFSGGEPLAQAPFLFDIARQTQEHVAVETSGYCPESVFQEAISCIDLILMDLKIINRDLHKRYTGVYNDLILANLQQLIRSGKKFVVRIPVIPGVNDSEENYLQTARLLSKAGDNVFVELLPYNTLAPAKYEQLGRVYPFVPPKEQGYTATNAFAKYGIRSAIYEGSSN